MMRIFLVTSPAVCQLIHSSRLLIADHISAFPKHQIFFKLAYKTALYLISDLFEHSPAKAKTTAIEGGVHMNTKCYRRAKNSAKTKNDRNPEDD